MGDTSRHPTALPRLLLLAVMCLNSVLVRGFDFRRHLGTKTRYALRLAVPGAPSIYRTPDPDGYEPVHLYLVSRHGSRWPTGDRMRQINSLETLFKDARNSADHPWLGNWTAPFADVDLVGGELHHIGADELWGLAYRLRQRFPSLSGQDYLPKRFPVVSTQVARTAASASAFTSGFFHEVGSRDPADDSPTVNPAPPHVHSLLGAAAAAAAGTGAQQRRSLQAAARGSLQRQQVVQQQQQRLAALGFDVGSYELDESLREQPKIRRPQAVAMSMAPKDADPLLRFFDVCPAYAQHDEYTEKWMSGWMQGNWSRLVPTLESRLGLSRPMTPCEVEALWQLCLLEAGLYGITDQACSLFDPEHALMLEWVDDIHLHETQSYGADINYRIAAPLLRDAATSLRAAARGAAAGGEEAPAARLLFAHCETLVPLASLLGLFKPPPLPPAPEPAPAAAREAAARAEGAVSAAAAQRHLLAVDSLEDLHVAVQGLRDLNAREARDAAAAPLPDTVSAGAEDHTSCYPGRKNKKHRHPAPPPPPGWRPPLPLDDSRVFKGARVAPFGANLALVLYRRKQGSGSGGPSHLVRLLYNEQVVPIPGCRTSNNSNSTTSDDDFGAASAEVEGLDCDLEQFLELVQDKIPEDALEQLCGKEGRVVAGAGAANAMYDSLPGAAAGQVLGLGTAAEAS